MKAMLAAEVFGRGAPLVAVHGWGFRAALWHAACPWLGERHLVHALDLPGHGDSPPLPPGVCPTGLLAQAAPPRAIWLGWSLGAQLALAFASLFPERVAALVLIAHTPRFTAAPDWGGGQAATAMMALRERLAAQPAEALAGFAALCAQGGGQRQALRILRTQVTPLRRAGGLDWGLDWLAREDQRAWPRPACPVLLLHGVRDVLIPRQAAQLQAARWGVACQLVTGAGHAPFVSHPAACRTLLEPWLAQAPA
jgi:pimeloyl-[acyl-carrier protein] methyl ester esterase